MDVLDQTLDSTTRTKVMMTNGKTCFSRLDSLPGSGDQAGVLRDLGSPAPEPSPAVSVRVEGNVIYFEYTGSAETGQASPEGICLCPTVESKPKGLSRDLLSVLVGYVKEMHERTFGRSCDVELLDSVLPWRQAVPVQDHGEPRRLTVRPFATRRPASAHPRLPARRSPARLAFELHPDRSRRPDVGRVLPHRASLENRPIPATLRMDIRAQSWARW